MSLEVVCEYNCLINAFISRCFPIVCSNSPDFADNKPFFGGFSFNKTFKFRKGFPKITWIKNKEDSWWINRSIFLIKVQKNQPAAYSLPFSPTAGKAEHSYQVRSFCMAALQFLSCPSLIHRGNQWESNSSSSLQYQEAWKQVVRSFISLHPMWLSRNSKNTTK